MQVKFDTLIMIGVVVAALLLSTVSSFAANRNVQSCNGVLIQEEDSYRLEPDHGTKSLWCDAYLDEGEGVNTKKVLKTCPLGSYCHIEGTFAGHGVFYWTKISRVKALAGTDP